MASECLSADSVTRSHQTGTGLLIGISVQPHNLPVVAIQHIVAIQTNDGQILSDKQSPAKQNKNDISSFACSGDSIVKRLTALLALTAALSLTTIQESSAQDYYYYEQDSTYTYDNSGYYYTPHTNEGVWYQESQPSVLGIFQPIRDTAGNAAELYMDIHPGAQIAESMGLLDRGFVLGLFRD